MTRKPKATSLEGSVDPAEDDQPQIVEHLDSSQSAGVPMLKFRDPLAPVAESATDVKQTRTRLNAEQRAEAVRLMNDGMSVADAASQFSVSYPTMLKIRNDSKLHETLPPPPPVSQPAMSPLKEKIYLIGFRYVMQESISDDELANVRKEIEEAKSKLIRQLALSL